MSIATLGFDPAFLSALEAADYPESAAVQRAAIPAMIGKKDVFGITKTGSGKTAGYVPAALAYWSLHHLLAKDRSNTGAIMARTIP